jgi:polar amino acid transport system substrate-binding protein
MLRKTAAAAFVFLASFAPAMAADVPMLTYHEFPPYVSDAKAGLTFELADYLTRKSGGAYTFVVAVMPRKRLDGEIEGGKPAVVPWVNPAWFGDKDKTKYQWSIALVQDANAVVSPAAKPVTYSGPDALAGLKLGGVSGHKYGGVDALVEAGKVIREDANSELLNLKKVAAGRVDVTVMADSGARFMAKRENLTAQLFFSPTPHSQYDRHLMVAGGDAKLAEFVKKTVDGMASDAEWKAIAAKYL